MMTKKEHILYFFLARRLPLHYSDRRFFSNITTRIKNTKQITSGQSLLFDKLVEKYYHRLADTKMSLDDLLNLDWECEVIKTAFEYTAAKVNLTDDILTIQCPTVPKFVQAFVNIPNNTFVWNNQARQYETKFNTMALKIALDYLPKYFKDVVFSDSIMQLLDQTFKEYLVWDPTLCKINTNYIVVASNDVIDQLLPSTLNNTPEVLYKLSMLGVSIHQSITNTDPILEFASQYKTEIDGANIEDLVTWLVALNIKKVVFGHRVSSTHPSTRNLTNVRIFKQIMTYLEKNNIEWSTSSDPEMTFWDDDTLPVLIYQHGDHFIRSTYYGKRAVGKCIKIMNSYPIEA